MRIEWKGLFSRQYSVSVFSFFILFASHRLLILPHLGFSLLATPFQRSLALGLGWCSDFWTSVLFSLPFLFLGRRWLVVAVVASTALLIFHIPYTQFFHVTFRHVHLRYLFDANFLLSSKSEILTLSALWQALAGVAVISVLFLRSSPLIRRARLQSALFFLIVLCGVFANYLANRYARKFDLAKKIVENVVISHVFDAIAYYKNLHLPPLTPQDQAILQALSPTFLIANGSLPLDQAQATSYETTVLSFVAESLRASFSFEELRRTPKHIFLILMESARAEDSHLVNPKSVGHWPRLDSWFQDGGIFFSQAYSTGTVSRSGAESFLCNALSSLLYNSMQESPLANPQCLPEILSSHLKEHRQANASFQWWHGGHLTFDGQGEFWRRQGFHIPLDVAKQPSSLPRSDWGLSDRSFFQLVLQGLTRHQARIASNINSNEEGPNHEVFVHALVTLSNHTAWVLPEDCPDSIRGWSATHPIRNHHTARYADFALDEFLSGLKDSSIWENSLLILVGDHGMQEPSDEHQNVLGFGHSQEMDLISSRNLSHVLFGVMGGLVQKAVKSCQMRQTCQGSYIHITDPISQADALPTVAHLFGLNDYPFFGVSVFERSRKFPVFTDLGEYIFFPEQPPALYSKQQFFEGRLSNPRHALGATFYKAYLTLTQQGAFTRALRRGERPRL